MTDLAGRADLAGGADLAVAQTGAAPNAPADAAPAPAPGAAPDAAPASAPGAAPDAAPGVIATDDERYNATLVRRVDQHESLGYYWVRFDGEPTPFEPGQYMTIGVFVDGRIVQRPYSVASTPSVAGETGYEFYLRLVNGGTFTPLLWGLPEGHRMRMIGPKGKFLLEPDDDRVHLFVSSGTGNAPFVSMMRDTLAAGRPRRAIFLNGVSHVRDLGYRKLVEDWEASWEYPVTFVPTISRPADPSNVGWTGRTGRVESIVAPVFADLGLSPDSTVAYLCGNPDMILSAEQTLLELGLPETAVKKELYWPKGKEPRGVAGAADVAAAADADE
jgi:ferredoxin-NADP reductase